MAVDRIVQHREESIVASEQENEAARRYVEAGKAAAAEARKSGTPEYDQRAHERAVEHERKMSDALAKEQSQQ